MPQNNDFVLIRWLFFVVCDVSFFIYYALLKLNERKMKVADAESGFSMHRDTKKNLPILWH